MLLGLGACTPAANGGSAPPPRTEAPVNASQTAVGSIAPAFAATALDGSPISLSDYHGKVLVLNFWATWCPPCRRETPNLIRAFGKLAAQDVSFLGIDTTETAPIVKSFLELKGVPYRIALGKPEIYNDYGVAYIPTTIVVDRTGVVRARWTGEVSPAQLSSYVSSAREGRNAEFLPPAQRRLDRMLEVSQFDFSGTPPAIRSQAARAKQQLAKAGAAMSALNASATPQYDFERTLHEKGELELAVAQAEGRVAATDAQRLAAYELLGTAYGDLNRFADAAAAYRRALALEPENPELVGDLTRAYYRLHDYDAMARTATIWTALAPHDPDAWDQLGLANQRRQNFAAAVPAYRRTLTLMIAAAGSRPHDKDGKTVDDIADESLDFANVYVALGDAANAKRAFDQARRYASLIPSGSPLAVMKERVRERTLEGLSAVVLARGSGMRLALEPWTGPNLPGSVSSTYRYRLVAVAQPGTNVRLGTKGLHSGWIASFCQDRLCSPNSVTFVMPSEGVKTYEFQLVPPVTGAVAGRVWVGTGSYWVSTRS